MTQQEIGWFCLIFGALYAVALYVFPSIFNNWFLCPRYGVFGPPSSRLGGIGAGLFLVSLGLVHLNAAHPLTPTWIPWCAVFGSVLIMIVGMFREPLYRDAA
ncbi:hypothetical protein [Luteimonas mephitis]|uniref:hypothetical protein n=1 Tax=Luteimonas mephitis TaxID=83615 RepID=UPI0012EC7002|nr:hypothetical protein [Luteimonas mephitis]